ncbi:hypothetical protein CBR_g41505 [Chara braunii]|uniref:Retrotransposon gag domain-containing protein n=1 Tax=Chara braunii TaxID=69332 RepID=A0A388LWB9_CHABU|nr:hypothetical protein CBR_g41505 [Chara braunii]|eukprot:GBG86512.1 hypothetical protein CBR_g41505 [Chara braunii]
MDATLKATEKATADAVREVERLTREKAEATRKGEAAAERSELRDIIAKVPADARVADVTRNLAELVLLESAHNGDVFTSWDERISSVESQLSSIDKKLEKLSAAFFRHFPLAPAPSPHPTVPPLSPPMTSTPQSFHPGSPRTSPAPPKEKAAQVSGTVPTGEPSSNTVQQELRFPKMAQPEKFTGEDPKVDVSDWIAQMRSYLRGYTCPEVDKARATLTLLSGAALKWATSEASKAQKQLDDWIQDAIFQGLETRFADKEKARKANDKLVRLGQSKWRGSLSKLYAEWEKLTSTPGLEMSE